MLVRVQLYDIVAVDEQRIAFDQDREQPLVLEAESGAAVGQRIGRHRRRGVERLAHAAADIAIPAAGTALRVDLRHPPQPQFEGMRAAAVAARDKLDDPDQNFYENYICDSNRNYTHSCDRELDKLIDQQSAESDQEKRRRLVSEIDRRLQDRVVRPILYHMRQATCWRPEVKGLNIQVNSIYNGWRMEEVWLDK